MVVHAYFVQAQVSASNLIPCFCLKDIFLVYFVNLFSLVLIISKGGDLCLSNTGLLGVVCLCHGLYMSISKFLEVIYLWIFSVLHCSC